MTTAGDLRSGKTHRDENFPVASFLIHPRHRAVIMAFYNFVRTADDVADHPTLAPKDKLDFLDRLEDGLFGRSEEQPEAVALHRALAARSMAPRHAQDLLNAFRLDVTKLRYADWDELIHYCSLSAMPVGRFMLDVHGEDRATWAASDALCAALQINNHLQDCAKDYRELDRVYLPQDALAASGASVEQLSLERAPPQLLDCLHRLAARNAALLAAGKGLGAEVRDLRLSLEVAVIQTYAEQIVALLQERDSLSEAVHLSRGQFMAHGLAGMAGGLLRWIAGRPGASRSASQA
ncbi:MAG: squalene synthase HpnC [Xanthobacteraceae bacterium]|nr:squalene synthase HpnC [Xanthobacteraceae bacterium]